MELEFRSVLLEEEKAENPQKNPWSKPRTSNKFNPHETGSTGIESESQRWDWGERLSAAPTMLEFLRASVKAVVFKDVGLG